MNGHKKHTLTTVEFIEEAVMSEVILLVAGTTSCRRTPIHSFRRGLYFISDTYIAGDSQV